MTLLLGLPPDSRPQTPDPSHTPSQPFDVHVHIARTAVKMLSLSPFWLLWLSHLSTAVTLPRADHGLDLSPSAAGVVPKSWETLPSKSLRSDSLPLRPYAVDSDIHNAELHAPQDSLTRAGKRTSMREDATAILRRDEDLKDMTFCSRPSSSPEKRSLPKRAAEDIGKMKPQDFDNPGSFMMSLSDRATKITEKANVDAEYRDFKSDQSAMAVTELGGCDVVVVISEKGLFMAHIYEVPNLVTLFYKKDGKTVERAEPTDENVLRRDVLVPLSRGGSGVKTGLMEMAKDGGPFAADADPYVLLLSRVLAGYKDDDYELYHEDHAFELRRSLKVWMPGSHMAKFIPYASQPAKSNVNLKTSPKGRLVVQYDPFDHLKGKGDDPDDDDYGEDEGCDIRIAKVRVWLEDREKPVFKHSWEAHDEQRNEN